MMLDQEIVVIENVPIVFDLDYLARRLHIRDEASQEGLARLAEEAERVGHPKAAARLRPLEAAGDDQVRIGGVLFTSALMREKMGALARVFPYLVTEGAALAAWAKSRAAGTDAALVGEVRYAALKQYEELLEKAVTERFGMRQVSAMKPGSLKEWPLEQEEQLFQVLSPLPQELGVRLLPSWWMDPPYSTAGVFFQTETKYYNCHLCPREDCPNRKAPRLTTA